MTKVHRNCRNVRRRDRGVCQNQVRDATGSNTERAPDDFDLARHRATWMIDAAQTSTALREVVPRCARAHITRPAIHRESRQQRLRDTTTFHVVDADED